MSRLSTYVQLKLIQSKSSCIHHPGQELGNWLAEDLPVPLPDVSLSLPEVTSILFFVEIIFNSFSTYICIPKSHDLVSLVLELHINKIVLCILPCSLFLLISYL